MVLQQLHAIVHGRVQGVSFRYNAQLKAQMLGLTGWVRNLADGTVETKAIGEHAVLEGFLAWLRIGPSGAKVSRVEATWSETAQPLPLVPLFEIKYGSDS
ncbi:MAG: acylphosphatase [Chloroflexota bacterium]